MEVQAKKILLRAGSKLKGRKYRSSRRTIKQIKANKTKIRGERTTE